MAELFTAQTRYAAEHGENAVLVCWEETVPQGPGGVDLIVDSQVAAHIDALPALWLPDCQCRLVTGLRENGPVPGGDFDGDGTPEDEELLHSFEVVGPDGHIGVQVQKVRDSQFFGDAREVTCGFIGASCADEEDDCEIEVGGNGGALLPVNDRGTGAGRREHSRLGGRRGRDPDRRGDRVAGPARRPLGCSVSL